MICQRDRAVSRENSLPRLLSFNRPTKYEPFLFKNLRAASRRFLNEMAQFRMGRLKVRLDTVSAQFLRTDWANRTNNGLRHTAPHFQANTCSISDLNQI